MTRDEIIKALKICSEDKPCGGCPLFEDDCCETTLLAATDALESEANANPSEYACIKDSGNRTEFETGAVRDVQEGKGRFDLMPLDVAEHFDATGVIASMDSFRRTGDTAELIQALNCAIYENFASEYEMLLEVAKHFEDGAKKYGPQNWQKGIPVSRYIDSALRHYCKHKAGYKDEPHDRAFVWNVMCCIWTMEHKPEMDDWTEKRADNAHD